MRERGVRNEDATADDIARCAGSWPRPSAAGAVGFSTSRTISTDRSPARPCPAPTPATWSCELVQGMADGAAGCSRPSPRRPSAPWRCSAASGSTRSTAAPARRISRATGQKITFTTVQRRDDPTAWRECSTSPSRRTRRRPAVPAGRLPTVGILGGLDGYHPFMRRPSYREVAGLPLAAQASGCASGGEGADPRRGRPRPDGRLDGDVRGGHAGPPRGCSASTRSSTTSRRPTNPSAPSPPGAASRRRGRLRLPRRRRRRRHRACRPPATSTATSTHAGDARAPVHGRGPRRRRRPREAHLRQVQPDHPADALDPRPHRGEHMPLEFMVEQQTRRTAPCTASRTGARSRWAGGPIST